jgi:prolyl-tRNA synthetase
MSKQGITSREENYSDWYNELVLRADLADYAPVRGCMVIKPNGYAIWELMQRALDDMFKETGHVNAYFPMLIPESFMKKEADHVEGFAPQCAVVTHGGGKELEESLYLRPTSETVIWHCYKKWIQSYRDLPLLINQWANVVRWELRTKLFLRTLEFLWQEGHTAHATYDEAETEARTILDVYAKFSEEWMAVPVITGLKTEIEKFAGADHTYCIEAMTQDLRAVQAGTSHHLGQNFAKAFDVTFQSAEGQLEYVYATSWGVSTRLIGMLIMAHSDDKGLVAPPRLAPTQVVVIPMGKDEETRAVTYPAADKIADQLKAILSEGARIRVKVDKREKESPGFKYNDWELKGACLRIELGPRDLEANSCILARRDTGEKSTVPLADICSTVEKELIDMQKRMFERALALRNDNMQRVDTWEEFKKVFDVEGGAGFVLAHWDGDSATEEAIADETKATIRCIPLNPFDPSDNMPGKCVKTGKESKQRVVFAKAY